MNPAQDPISISYQPEPSLPITQTQTSFKNLCFTIEGNIGCGKSTFLEVLRQRFPQAVWIQQPVKEWQDIGGKGINMLQRYYKEPTRWGFTFQIYAIFTRIKKMEQACLRHPNKLKISQRSILADKYVFAELMKDLGYMQNCEYEVYKQLFQNFAKSTKIEQTKIVYLRCSPKTCQKRTKQRKRPEQAQIPLQYLTMIHDKHEKWFEEYDKEKVLIIDTDKSFKNDEKRINEIMDQLKGFLYPVQQEKSIEKQQLKVHDEKDQ